MQTFHADQFVLPLPPGHTFPMGKYRLLREAVEAGAVSAARYTSYLQITGEPT